MGALSACTPAQLLALQQIQQQNQDRLNAEEQGQLDNLAKGNTNPTPSNGANNDFEETKPPIDDESELLLQPEDFSEQEPELEELKIVDIEEAEFTNEEEVVIEEESVEPELPPVESKPEDVEPLVINGKTFVCAKRAMINLRWGQFKFNQNQAKAQVWPGSIRVKNGIVRTIKPLKFEGKDKMVPTPNPSLVGWKSVTKPHWDGISVMVLAPMDGPEPEIKIRTGHGTKTYKFSELNNLNEKKVVDRLGNQVEVRSKVLKKPLFCALPDPEPRPRACAPRALVKMRWGQFRFNKDIKRARKWPGQIRVTNGEVHAVRRLKFESRDRLFPRPLQPNLLNFLTATSVHWDGVTALLFANPEGPDAQVNFKLPGINRTISWSDLDGFKAKKRIDLRGNMVEIKAELLPSLSEARPELDFPCEFKELPDQKPEVEVPIDAQVDEFSDPESIEKPSEPVEELDPETLPDEPTVEEEPSTEETP